MDMYLEKNRLQTFKNWPYSSEHSCSAAKVAQAGFYFIGNKDSPDLVECFLCGKTLENWEDDDNPINEHKSHASYCEFAKFGRCEDDLTIRELTDIKRLYVQKIYEDQIQAYENTLKKMTNSRATNKRKPRIKKEKQ